MKYDLKNKRVSIIGAGRTGVAASEAVYECGGVPFVSDSSINIDENIKRRLQEINIEFETAGHSDRVFDCDLMILSPGVLPDSKIAVEAKSRGIAVWAEIELAYRICAGKIIGVTGSNGKTTTTTLIGEILKNFGVPTYVCGNIGNPFIKFASEIPPDGYAVVELSSFQLEMIDKFRPDIAAILNITPDHLDRHGNINSYAAAKLRIFENQDDTDISIVNYDDTLLRSKCRNLKSRTRWFSVKSDEAEIYGSPEGSLIIENSELMKSRDIKLIGVHNLSNVCAAVAAAKAVGVNDNSIIDTLRLFAGVEHRLEFVRLIGGISFINDSKGTNVDSVYWALKAVSSPVILIAGGRDKAGDFKKLSDLIKEKVKTVVLIGEAADKIKKVWKGLSPFKFAVSIEEAVSLASEEAISGDTILLSPGCASFDMFKNYEERGLAFKNAVSRLEEGSVKK